MLRWVLAASVLLALPPSAGRADVIFGTGYECPRGSVETFSHAGAWCAGKSCADACLHGDPCDCAGGGCRSWRLCTVEITYQTRGPQLEPVEQSDRAVVNSCPPEEECTGWAVPHPRGPTEFGPVECEVQRACVAAPIPSELDQLMEGEPESAGCACRSDGGPGPGSGVLAGIVLGVLTRRRDAANSREGRPW